MIISTPIKAIAPPIVSILSGTTLSTCQPQRIDKTMKIPPYVAYTLPKLALVVVGLE
jgi:hypothetical protein